MSPKTTDREAELNRLRNALDGFSSGRKYRKLAADVEKWRTECREARRTAETAVAERDALQGKVVGYERAISWDTSCTEHGRLLDAVRAAEEQRDEAQGQVAALQRELAEARETIKLHEACAPATNNLAKKQRLRAEQAERELTEAKRAVYTAHHDHIRDTHPNRPHVADCLGCRVLVPLSAAMPARPDDPEEIRRLAQATTESTED